MRCPNCRCYVPMSMEYCGYCGYRFEDGSARTLSVTEAYADRFYSDSDYYGYYGVSQELAVKGDYHKGYSYSWSTAEARKTETFSFLTVMALLLGLCAVFLLLIMALLILLI